MLKTYERDVLKKESQRIYWYQDLVRLPAWLDLKTNFLEKELKKYAKIAGSIKRSKDERLAALQAINIYKQILDYPDKIMGRASSIEKILSGVNR